MNDAVGFDPRGLRVAVIGNEGGRRVAALQEALAALGAPAARVVAYRDLLDGRTGLGSVLEPGTVLRIESPDRDFAVERGLIALGADGAEEEHAPVRIGQPAALRLELDRGRILYPRQWYLGFRALLDRIDAQRAACPPHVVMSAPHAIGAMFDKPRCRALFETHGVPCPRGLCALRGYDDLRARMAQQQMPRVFVKLAHGSSASGVVALETQGRRVRACTTVEMVRQESALRLYNTRALRRHESEAEVAALVDALCHEGAYAEQWVPKASLPGGTFDLRVVVIADRAAHVVVRQSRTPMTNLHLLNRRGDVQAVQARLRADGWNAALAACERACGLFPQSLYAGADLVIAAGFRRHAVLEINAFGDLLPGVTHRGYDTYTAELVALAGRVAA